MGQHRLPIGPEPFEGWQLGADLARALALPIALAALMASPVLAQQAAQSPAAATAPSAGTSSAPDTAYRVTPPRAPAPRPRSRDPRDRAFMDGGVPSTPGFSGFGERTPAAPPQLGELAPRPNRDIEWSAPPPPPTVATISPTLINPRMPSRGAAADGAVTQRDQRFLENPAPGARFSVPMTW